jgi:hypothetical protein
MPRYRVKDLLAVDAQNSFGAMLRKNWYVQMRWDADREGFIADTVSVD